MWRSTPIWTCGRPAPADRAAFARRRARRTAAHRSPEEASRLLPLPAPLVVHRNRPRPQQTLREGRAGATGRFGWALSFCCGDEAFATSSKQAPFALILSKPLRRSACGSRSGHASTISGRMDNLCKGLAKEARNDPWTAMASGDASLSSRCRDDRHRRVDRALFRRAHDRDEVRPEGPPSCLTLRTAPRAIAYFRHRLRNSVMDDISSHYLVLDSRR